MRYVLAISVVLALGYSGQAIGADRPLRLAQNQTSAACFGNCNTAYATCANQCPVAGNLSQIAPDINVATNIQGKSGRNHSKEPADSMSPELHKPTAVLLGDVPLRTPRSALAACHAAKGFRFAARASYAASVPRPIKVSAARN